MIKKHLKLLFVTILFFIFTISTNSLAGTTGKISGKSYIDATNGEPLIGAM